MRAAVTGLVVAASLAACASAPPPPPVQTPAPAPVITIDRKAGWILRLEHERVLAGPEAGADLLRLVADPDAALRRRAALALGRVGHADAVPALIAALADADESVRATAAFALGLLADARGEAPLAGLLADPSPLVRGRAADALGLMSATSSASAIAASSTNCAALLAPMAPDDESHAWPAEVEACRLAVLALVRLRDYAALARVVLNDAGAPVSTWWPVAFALQRSGDPRSAGALASLVGADGVYAPAFALRGLAALGDARAATPALAWAGRADADVRLRAQAIRALGEMGERRAVAPLTALIEDPATVLGLRLEALAALGALADGRALDAVLECLRSPRPEERAAAVAAAARIDGAALMGVLSTSERDGSWLVRARLADALGGLEPDLAEAALQDLAADPDSRVQTAALRGLARQGAADIDRRAAAALGAPDASLRAAAAAIIGDRRPASGAASLAAAYTRALTDATPAVRLAVIAALQRYPDPAPDATATLTRALTDPEWAVRLRAAAGLRQRGQPSAAPARPAPARHEPAFFESDGLLRPRYSPQAYLETAAGVIQLELDVVNAPLTTQSFIALARAGFYDGVRIHRLIPNFVMQAGDPRGDGEGGPGFTVRDEFSPRTFVRGAVGMALAGPETGGSQFFIALSPQPHLDGRYTVFGRVVTGLERLDALALGDAITRITIADGSGR